MNHAQRTPNSAVNDASVGTTAWTNPGNAVTSNSTPATVTLAAGATSQYLKCTDFKFDTGPDPIKNDATIRGVEVLVQVYQDAGDAHTSVTVTEVKLVKGGTIGGSDGSGNRAILRSLRTLTDFGTRSTSRNVVLDLWGNSLTAADILGSGFGVAIRVKNNHGSLAANLRIEAVQLRVYWARTPTVTLRTNYSSGMVPHLIAVDAIQSAVGDDYEEECEYRWVVTGPVGWSKTIADPRPGTGVNGQIRNEANSKTGFSASWIADVVGSYTIECQIYTPSSPSTPVAVASTTVSVTADTRAVRFVNSGGNDTTGDGLTEGTAWLTLGKAFTAVPSNLRLVLKDGDTLTLNNVSDANNLTNVVIETIQGAAAYCNLNCTGTTGGMSLTGVISRLMIHRVKMTGNQANLNNTCWAISSGGLNCTRNDTAAVWDCTIVTPAFAFQFDDIKYVQFRGITGSNVHTYGIFSNAAAFVEIIGYDMTADPSAPGGNGHFRYGAAADTVNQSFRGVGWSWRWSKWDCNGSALAGLRAPGSYKTIQECYSSNGGVAIHSYNSGTNDQFCASKCRISGCFLESTGALLLSGYHVFITDTILKSVSTNAIFDSENANAEHLRFTNCTFWADSAPSFEGWCRHYTNTPSNVYAKTIFYFNCGFFAGTYTTNTFYISDRADVNVNLVQILGGVDRCVFPSNTANTRFEWSDGSAHGDTIAAFDARSFVGSVPTDTDGSTTLIPATTAYQPDVSLTQWRTAGTRAPGSYRDYLGGLRDQTASVWAVGARAGSGGPSYSTSDPVGPTGGTVSSSQISDIPGLVSWKVAEDINLADNTTVTTWTDRANTAYNGTASGTPKYRTGIVNGKPVVRFAKATSDSITFGSAISLGDFTLFVVHQTSGDCMLLSNSSTNYQIRVGRAGANVLSCYDNGAVGEGISNDLVVSRSTWQAAEFNRWREMCAFSNSGTPRGKGSFGGTGSFNTIGNFLGTPSLDGDVAEYILYSRKLTVKEEARVYDYIKARYNITPAIVPTTLSHPVRSTPLLLGVFQYQAAANVHAPSYLNITTSHTFNNVDTASVAALLAAIPGKFPDPNAIGYGSLDCEVNPTVPPSAADYNTAPWNTTGRVGIIDLLDAARSARPGVKWGIYWHPWHDSALWRGLTFPFQAGDYDWVYGGFIGGSGDPNNALTTVLAHADTLQPEVYAHDMTETFADMVEVARANVQLCRDINEFYMPSQVQRETIPYIWPQQVPNAVGMTIPAFSGGSWTSSSKILNKLNAFTNLVLTGNPVYDRVTVLSGTGITPGQYVIASKTDNSNIVLTTSMGPNASDVSASSVGIFLSPTNYANRLLAIRMAQPDAIFIGGDANPTWYNATDWQNWINQTFVPAVQAAGLAPHRRNRVKRGISRLPSPGRI